MATNDPNKPDNVTYIDPGNKTPAEENAAPEAGGEAAPPEMTAEEAEALAHEGEKALHDIGEEQLEPPALFDLGGAHIPDPGEAEKTAGPDKEPAPPPPEAPAAEEQAPAKKGRGGRPPKADKSEKAPGPPDKADPAGEGQPKKRGGRPPKADKAEKAPDKSRAPVSPEDEKTLSDYQKELDEWNSKEPWERSADPPKRPKPPKAPKEAADGKQQPADKTKAPAKEETPPAPTVPEKPPEPREAPRPNGTDQIAAFLLIVTMQSCVGGALTIGNGILGAISGTSYLAEDSDINGAELAYSEWEADLLYEAQNAESSHPGYDEYRFDIDSVGHDPIALNTKMGTLRLLKVCAETGKPLAGATYLLYDAQGNVLGEYTTNTYGVIEFKDGIEPQKLKVKEIKCPAGYVLDSTIYEVEVKAGATAELAMLRKACRSLVMSAVKSIEG